MKVVPKVSRTFFLIFPMLNLLYGDGQCREEEELGESRRRTWNGETTLFLPICQFSLIQKVAAICRIENWMLLKKIYVQDTFELPKYCRKNLACIELSFRFDTRTGPLLPPLITLLF